MAKFDTANFVTEQLMDVSINFQQWYTNITSDQARINLVL